MNEVERVHQTNQTIEHAVLKNEEAKAPARERKSLWMLVSFCVGLALLVALNMR